MTDALPISAAPDRYAGSGKLTVVLGSEERLLSWPDIKVGYSPGLRPESQNMALASRGLELPLPDGHSHERV